MREKKNGRNNKHLFAETFRPLLSGKTHHGKVDTWLLRGMKCAGDKSPSSGTPRSGSPHYSQAHAPCGEVPRNESHTLCKRSRKMSIMKKTTCMDFTIFFHQNNLLIPFFYKIFEVPTYSSLRSNVQKHVSIKVHGHNEENIRGENPTPGTRLPRVCPTPVLWTRASQGLRPTGHCTPGPPPPSSLGLWGWSHTSLA